jgi:hypothetical protein
MYILPQNFSELVSHLFLTMTCPVVQLLISLLFLHPVYPWVYGDLITGLSPRVSISGLQLFLGVRASLQGLSKAVIFSLTKGFQTSSQQVNYTDSL